MTDPSPWRDRLAPHAAVLLGLVLLATSMVAARWFAPPGAGPSSSPVGTGGPGGPTGDYGALS